MAAITRKTQKDIGNYEAKFIGPFTSRQTALIGGGLVPAFIAILIARQFTNDIFTYLGIAMVFMAIPAFLAFGSKLCYGMKPEEFLAEWYFYHYKCPKERLYKTQTFDDVLVEQAEEELNKESDGKKNKTKSKKKQEKPKPHKRYKGFRSFE